MNLALVPRPQERLSPLERLEVLCDPGSINLLRSDVRSRRMGDKARAGDGVLGASARVDRDLQEVNAVEEDVAARHLRAPGRSGRA